MGHVSKRFHDLANFVEVATFVQAKVLPNISLGKIEKTLSIFPQISSRTANQRSFRRRTPSIPSTPIASIAMVPGSGMTQPPPNVVQSSSEL